MKKRLPALVLSLCLALTGCAAMLERSYESVTAHVDRPATGDDPSILRVENYRELISAVLYLVSQGQEEGTIQLHDYAGTVENDLSAACLEVATQDPLGAYCVDYIEHDMTRVMSYYQASLSIRYRRTAEQIRSIVNVTGTRAIRDKLSDALKDFDPQVVLRVTSFAEDEESIARLFRQAYYDNPAVALGLPEIQVSLYPDSGRERIVEIDLTYPDGVEALQRRSEAALEAARPLGLQLGALSAPEAGYRVAQRMLAQQAENDPDSPGDVYAALVDGRANAQGLALAYALICQQAASYPCQVVEGTRRGEPHFWNQVSPGGRTLYLDPTLDDGLYTAQELFDLGYRWPDGPQLEGETAPAETVPTAE